jgi:hypothetical protein
MSHSVFSCVPILKAGIRLTLALDGPADEYIRVVIDFRALSCNAKSTIFEHQQRRRLPTKIATLDKYEGL